VPPQAATHAGYLCKRLKKRFPELEVLIALWTTENTDKAQARLRDAGADLVASNVPAVIEALRQLTVPVSLAMQNRSRQA
jgi:hypothetical protein